MECGLQHQAAAAAPVNPAEAGHERGNLGGRAGAQRRRQMHVLRVRWPTSLSTRKALQPRTWLEGMEST